MQPAQQISREQNPLNDKTTKMRQMRKRNIKILGIMLHDMGFKLTLQRLTY